MKVITFYAYKGGTGRSLLLANTARFLAWGGRRVAALDLDLEAPGLSYKFGVSPATAPSGQARQKGVVDYILECQELDTPPHGRLADYSVNLGRQPGSDAEVVLIPAGDSASRHYASQLARLDWHSLMRVKGTSERPRAVEIFDSIASGCEQELRADFLVVDSRTGLTDVGTLALHVLSNHLVCLMVNNHENLCGTRQVLRAVAATNAAYPGHPIECTLAITRFGEDSGLRPGREEGVVEAALEFLCAPLGPQDGGERVSLTREQVVVLHSDRELELEEGVLFDGQLAPSESLLFRDYHTFFGRLGLTQDLAEEKRDLIDLIAKSQAVRSSSFDEWTADRLTRGHLFESVSDAGRATVVQRVEARSPPELLYLSTEFHRQPKLTSLVDAVATALAKRISTREPKKTTVSGTYWTHLVGLRMLEGEFDFCGEPYYLTWLRSHVVEIVQYGWLEHFSLVFAKGSPFAKRLDAEAAKGEPFGGEMLELPRIIGEVSPAISLGVLGETAAASECVRQFGTGPATTIGKIETLTTVPELAEWFKADPSARLVACDSIIADKIADDAGQKNFAADSRLRIRFGQKIPVGIPYPRGDREWRGLISKALLEVLDALPDFGVVREELRRGGIDAFHEAQLRRSLLLDLSPRELRAYPKRLLP